MNSSLMNTSKSKFKAVMFLVFLDYTSDQNQIYPKISLPQIQTATNKSTTTEYVIFFSLG